MENTIKAVYIRMVENSSKQIDYYIYVIPFAYSLSFINKI
jgi:hypothetical protein